MEMDEKVTAKIVESLQKKEFVESAVRNDGKTR
jgi:hypothetical protein